MPDEEQTPSCNDMLARELLIALDDGSGDGAQVQSCAICLLSALRDTPATPSDITDECNISRKTVYEKTDLFIEADLVDRTRDGFELTGAGAMVLQEWTSLSSTAHEALNRLPSSVSRRELLDRLSTQPATKAELDNRTESISYSSIQRALSKFETEGLVTLNNRRQYELTEDGVESLEYEKEFLATLDSILDYILILQYFAPECDDFPAHAIDEAQLVTSSRDRPRTERNAYIEFLNELEVPPDTHFRLFSAYYDEEMGEFFLKQFLDEGAQIDVISPQQAINNIPTSVRGAKQVQSGLKSDNFSWQLYPGDLPIGLTIVGDEYAIFYPRRPVGGVADSAILFSRDEAVIEWAHELFAEYEAQSRRPIEQLLKIAGSLGVSASR